MCVKAALVDPYSSTLIGCFRLQAFTLGKHALGTDPICPTCRRPKRGLDSSNLLPIAARVRSLDHIFVDRGRSNVTGIDPRHCFTGSLPPYREVQSQSARRRRPTKKHRGSLGLRKIRNYFLIVLLFITDRSIAVGHANEVIRRVVWYTDLS